MKIIYPAIVHDDPDGYWLEFPDIEGCQTQGDTLDELLDNAAEALECYVLDELENGRKLPESNGMKSIRPPKGCFSTLVRIDADLAKNTRSVKKTLTIPVWLNDRAAAKGINFSKTLQTALLEQIA